VFRMKVICAGLSKTGTKSLAKALRILGFTVFDFKEHRTLHLNAWFDIYCEGKSPDFVSMYKDVDAVTDLPPAFWFEEIYETFPDAKVILSLRDNEDIWLQSWVKQLEILHTLGGLLNRVLLKWPATIVELMRGKDTFSEFLDLTITAAYGSLNWKSTTLFKKKYREHNERVQAVIPKEKLLIYNVKQGWKPLCEFLGCEVPKVEFPSENMGLSLSHLYISEGTQQQKRLAVVILAVFAIIVSTVFLLCH